MVEIAHVVMLLGALAGTGAALAPGRRARALDAVASVVMAAAMLDTAFTRLLPGLAWAVAFVAAGIAIGIRSRVSTPERRRRPVQAARSGLALADLHHALALIATGWLLAGSGAGTGADGATSGATSAGSEVLATHAHAGSMLPLQAIAVVAVVVLGTCVAVRAARSGRTALRHGAMAAGMSVMLAAMAAPAAVAALAG